MMSGILSHFQSKSGMMTILTSLKKVSADHRYAWVSEEVGASERIMPQDRQKLSALAYHFTLNSIVTVMSHLITSVLKQLNTRTLEIALRFVKNIFICETNQ